MTDYRAFLRRRILEDIYDRMSDDEKRLFVQMTMQNKSAEEILARLDGIDKRIVNLNGGKAFVKDFAANVLGNYFADASIYLGAKIIKAIR